MKPSAKRSKKTAARATARAGNWRELARRWLLALFVAVCVGRPLVPSEGVSWLGDGHPFTIILLAITCCYLLMAIERGRFSRSLGLVDAAVGGLVFFCVASATIGVLVTLFEASTFAELNERVSSPRPAINMLWEWVGLGLVFFLARQLIVTALESRALVATMIAVAVVLSAFGVYQVFVTLPAERAAYEANPDAVLGELGQWFPEGSAERARFEDRLRSTEPIATFALANSLAGYLAPWLVVALGVAWTIVDGRAADEAATSDSRRGKALRWGRLAGLAACLAAIVVCLVLTKSRSAYLAVAVGLALLPFSNATFRRRLDWRWIVAALAALAVVVGVAMAGGTLDAQVVTEASKSLGYRMEYWQATLDMIAQFPVFGVGPGEFQDYYTQYKRPEASEEIRDPHNFLLEVWATGGTPAFLALVVVLAGFAWKCWEATTGGAAPSESSGGAAPGGGSPSRTTATVAAGAALGVLLAFGLAPVFGFGFSVGQLACGLALGGAVLAILWRWVSGGALAAHLAALGVLVLAINLLAAGGFTFPGVAGTFWILMALALNEHQPSDRAQAAPGWMRRPAPAVAFGIAVVATVACYSTALAPVLASRAALARAADERLSDEERVAALLKAAEADWFSADPWIELARLSVARLKEDPSADRWGKRLINATTAVVKLRGRSSAAWREAAGWWREIYLVDPGPELAKHVVELARGAAFLYPNSAPIQAEYAVALEAVDNETAARRSALKALELDRQTPHADKKLPADLQRRLEKLLAEPPQPGPSPDEPAVVE